MLGKTNALQSVKEVKTVINKGIPYVRCGYLNEHCEYDIDYQNVDRANNETYKIPELALKNIEAIPGYCPKLINQGLNYSETDLLDVRFGLDVGAIYVTEDGALYVYFDVLVNTVLTTSFYLTKMDTELTTVTITNISDNSIIKQVQSTTADIFTDSFTIPSKGKYLMVMSGPGIVQPGDAVYGNGGILGEFTKYITRVFFGNNVHEAKYYAFSQIKYCTTMVFSTSITKFDKSRIQYGHKIDCVILPKETSIYAMDTYGPRYLRYISMNSGTHLSLNNQQFEGSHTIVPERFIANTRNGDICTVSPFTNSMLSLRNAYFYSTYLWKVNRNVFYQCNLEEIYLPAGVTEIGDNNFTNCCYLERVFLASTTPPSLYEAPTGCDACTFYVPMANVDDYKTATNWSAIADKIVGYNY